MPDDWNTYRRGYLTPNGWRYAGPGCYVHEETGAEWHPHDWSPEHGCPNWRALAERNEAPGLFGDGKRPGRRAVKVEETE